ncbi:hypothetical protein FOL47_009325 [Perkinsus chesapeaki]|uniref:Uncharacterized protein n=1 Tax=Perkinsus chesapeaki TaxID=330153 RepID=A0A7J6L935_PERCH|nr:hypothetical protein FOL47_009325 [Perkinsus chesapeaki]
MQPFLPVEDVLKGDQHWGTQVPHIELLAGANEVTVSGSISSHPQVADKFSLKGKFIVPELKGEADLVISFFKSGKNVNCLLWQSSAAFVLLPTFDKVINDASDEEASLQSITVHQ